jgi:4-amino-4-deoxy-L-arabinose transferase-like glycosyltransferase
VGAVTSFVGLDFSLDIDEFYYALAGRSLLRDGSLRLGPGLSEYGRARLGAYMVAASYAVFGDGGAASRVPSGVFTCLGVGLIFLAGRRFFGTSAGLWAAGFAAVFPLFVRQARTCRMYPHARFFTLLTAFLVFFVIERVSACSDDAADGGWRGVGRWLRSWRGICLVAGAVISAGLMMHFHVLGAVLVPGMLIYVAYLLICDVRRLGFSRTLRTPMCVTVLACTAVGAVAVVAFGPGLDYFSRPFEEAAAWTRGQHSAPLRYHRMLRDQGPLLYAIMPLGVLLAVFRRPRRPGVYCSCLFVTAFLLLSFGFVWKEHRFLSVHMAPYFLLCGLAAATVSGLLAKWFSSFFAAGARVKGAGLVALAAVAAFAATGLPQRTRYAMLPSANYNHRAALEYVKEHWKDGDAIATRRDVAALYYLGSVDYVLCATDERLALDTKAETIYTKGDLTSAVEGHRRLWLAFEKEAFDADETTMTLSPEVWGALRTLKPVYVSPPQPVLVFLVEGRSDLNTGGTAGGTPADDGVQNN